MPALNTTIWTGILLVSGLVDGLINIWAFRHAERIERLASWEFAGFVLLGTLVYMVSIALFLAALVAAPARPGFTFIWPVSVVLFTAIVLAWRGDVSLSPGKWAVGIVLALLPLLYWSWIGEAA